MPEQYGEVVYAGKVIPSCAQCAEIMGIRWRPAVNLGQCQGCQVELVP